MAPWRGRSCRPVWQLGPLAFLNPWLLLAAASLPVIWWLIRVTPPSPRRIRLPSIRLLFGLPQTEETPARTPPWLLLLRLLLALLAILALAHPVWNPVGREAGDGPLLVVVDDGWTAASRWSERQQVLAEIGDRAVHEGRPVVLLATAAPSGGGAVAATRLMRANEARAVLAALQPKPWASDRAAAATALQAVQLEARAQVLWLADGVEDGHAVRLVERLASFGPITLYDDAGGRRPLAVLPPAELGRGSGLRAKVLTAGGSPGERWLRVSAEGGRLLTRAPVAIGPVAGAAEAVLDLPEDLRNEAVRLELEGEASAGAVVLLDERWRRRPVGVLSGGGIEERAQPLLSNVHYLLRALEPFAQVHQGELGPLLARPLAMLVLADVGQLPPAERQRIATWLEGGGVLVRFAGPKLAQNADELVPVALRAGGRALGGAMSWTTPARIAAFSEEGPFSGLAVPRDVTVSSQVLAEPTLDLDGKTWARLGDGTPLVTGERRGRGWLVLFHTTANTTWSNLALSGSFVEMLRRLVALGQGVTDGEAGRLLPPLLSLDGFGRLERPPPAAVPLAGEKLAETAAAPRTPPGFYGTDEARRALNLTAGLRALVPLPAFDLAMSRATYAERSERDLKPWLLAAAIVLALADLLAVLALRGVLPRGLKARAATAALLFAALAAMPDDGHAQARPTQGADGFALQATLDTRLAFVQTGEPDVDEMSRAGLFGLGEVLRRRTAVELADPLGVDVERDELVFFPLLYWPVVPGQRGLSDGAIARLDTYMRTGGTIVFDTRDANTVAPGLGRELGRAGVNAEKLRQMLRRLDIPPLVPVPQDHILTKAFYLMQDFPGRHAGGKVWVEIRPGGVNDGVSAVVIGANDWAAAWATDEAGRPLAAVVPGGQRQREMAFRFGVNLVMYTLTGNYKADQVHLPAILERLGQ